MCQGSRKITNPLASVFVSRGTPFLFKCILVHIAQSPLPAAALRVTWSVFGVTFLLRGLWCLFFFVVFCFWPIATSCTLKFTDSTQNSASTRSALHLLPCSPFTLTFPNPTIFLIRLEHGQSSCQPPNRPPPPPTRSLFRLCGACLVLLSQPSVDAPGLTKGLANAWMHQTRAETPHAEHKPLQPPEPTNHIPSRNLVSDK